VKVKHYSRAHTEPFAAVAHDERPTIDEVRCAVHLLEARVDKTLDDHEHRLRRIEKWLYALPPTLMLVIASALAALSGR
jgi:hypothetical protein